MGGFYRFAIAVNLLWSPLLCHTNNEDEQRNIWFPKYETLRLCTILSDSFSWILAMVPVKHPLSRRSNLKVLIFLNEFTYLSLNSEVKLWGSPLAQIKNGDLIYMYKLIIGANLGKFILGSLLLEHQSKRHLPNNHFRDFYPRIT